MDTGYTGWLPPDADFIQCEGWEHVNVAEDIAKKLGIYNEEMPADETLIEHGWIRISLLTTMDFGLVFGKSWKNFATDRQKEYLRKLFDESKDIIAEGGFYDLYQLGVIDKDEYEEAEGGCT